MSTTNESTQSNVAQALEAAVATTIGTTPKVDVTANPAISTAVKALAKAESKVTAALDNLRNVARSETTKHGYTEKQLSAVLFESGLTDPARVSEIKGFVFPAHAAARQELDKALEMNAKADTAKTRPVPKAAILAIQRDKTGSLTVEAAIEAIKAPKTRAARPPGSASAPTHPVKPKTAQDQADEINALFSSAAKLSLQYGYEAIDFDAEYEGWRARFGAEIFGETKADQAADDNEDREPTDAELAEADEAAAEVHTADGSEETAQS